ncbi:MAG: glycerophosphodiester phosphodiesterase family protein [Acutalibacteraceae bacterium]|nr:glycerophosphodiester phosphodiesterase family protein [Acutalibacteraceae bacterium]
MPYIIGLILVFGLLFLFLIFPSLRKHNDLKVLKGLYIAHRGLHDIAKGIPENSIPAFREAIKYGFAIENDIHLTKDGQVVVFHDDDMKRMCSLDRKIKDMTIEEIKKLRLLNTSFTVPTLKECLEEIDGKVPLLIEFKYDGNSKALCEKANEVLSEYTGKYFVQSFYPQNLYWYRKNRKDICRGQLSCSFKGEAFYKKLSGCLLFNFISRPDFVSYEHIDEKHFCRRLVTKLGAFPVGWVFKSRQEIDKQKNNFHTYIFEDFIPE